MNKSELIDAIASGANLSKADAARALNATTGAITLAITAAATFLLAVLRI